MLVVSANIHQIVSHIKSKLSLGPSPNIKKSAITILGETILCSDAILSPLHRRSLHLWRLHRALIIGSALLVGHSLPIPRFLLQEVIS